MPTTHKYTTIYCCCVSESDSPLAMSQTCILYILCMHVHAHLYLYNSVYLMLTLHAHANPHAQVVTFILMHLRAPRDILAFAGASGQCSQLVSNAPLSVYLGTSLAESGGSSKQEGFQRRVAHSVPKFMPGENVCVLAHLCMLVCLFFLSPTYPQATCECFYISRHGLVSQDLTRDLTTIWRGPTVL